jgi:tetratricopeptide (TPR) repeat protein
MICETLLLAVFLQAPPPAAPEPVEPVEPAVTTPAPADPASAGAAIQAGLTAFRKRQWGRAEESFQRALSSDPQSAAAAYYLGYSIYKSVERRPRHADKQRALEYFHKAFTLDPAFRPDWGRPKR